MMTQLLSVDHRLDLFRSGQQLEQSTAAQPPLHAYPQSRHNVPVRLLVVDVDSVGHVVTLTETS